MIAEAGSNHDGKRDQAKRLIEVAAEAGADAVKFQLFTAARLYPPNAGVSDYLGVRKSIYDIIRDAEMPREWLPKLAGHCRKFGVEFLASPFDQESADALDTYVDVYKIASYEMTHYPLIDHILKKRKPIILSTGTASLAEVREVVRRIRRRTERLILLQCTAAYPVPLSAINVRVIESFRREFGLICGLSDHSADHLAAPMAATALGAKVIEKHYTLDKKLKGPDHPNSLSPAELKEMITRIRQTEAVLGSPVKRCEPVERELHAFARRCVFTSRPIRMGERFTEENTEVLRRGKHAAGLAPKFHPRLLGRKSLRALAAFQPLRASDVG